MTNNVFMLPDWKKNGTAEDRFNELAVMARLYPEKFSRVVVIYEEDLPDDRSKMQWAGTPLSTRELLGIITQALFEIQKWARKGND